MIILYSTNCPKCKVLETKLKQQNIDFILETDLTKMINMGYMEAPLLEINDEIYNFSQAIKWLKGE